MAHRSCPIIALVRAAILAVGSELLGADRVETNSLRLAAVLADHGVELVGKVAVGDDEARIAAAVRRLLEDADLLLVTGGLGPTADDRTRQGVARALARPLERDEAVARDIRAKFARLGREMPEVNLRQAERIAGAELIANPRGTAPGMRLTADGSTLFLFPGVPAELETMIDDGLAPWLARHAVERRTATQTLRVACVPESEVEERLAPLYARFGPQGITLLPAPGDVSLRVTVQGADRVARLEAMVALARECLGEALYAEREEDTLEVVVGRLLVAARASVATAESCTGGLAAERLTRVPGSSGYFLGAVVAYDNRVKRDLLGVADELLERHGAVSREVAVAMALGCRERFGSDWALAITGIAGPGGGSAEKPVGTVHVALAGPGSEPRHLRCLFPGERQAIRRQAAQWGIDLLRQALR